MREIKIRKPHKCECCGLELQPGELVNYDEGRSPRYDRINYYDRVVEEKQIGIQYYKIWMCGDSKVDECGARAMGMTLDQYREVYGNGINNNI